MKVLVCGGRDYTDEDRLAVVLAKLHSAHTFTTVIHGAARGADTLARLWAERMKIPAHPFPADWERHGRAAGPIRNQQMLDEGKPDLVVAFPGGRGTAGMVKLAQAAGVAVEVIAP